MLVFIPGSSTWGYGSFKARISSPDSAKILSVPYISQGATSWCFESLLEMVLGYWGESVDVTDFASASGHGPAAGNNVFDIFWGWVHPYLSARTNLVYEYDILGWDFDRYRAEIDNNVPVIVSFFGLPGHTVVVVGYSPEDGERYLYLNDPSGYLTDLKWDTGAVSRARVSWTDFSGLHWTELVISLHDSACQPSFLG